MDIYKVAKPVIYISRIFGIAPFTYCDTDLYKLKLSTFWKIYSSFWSLIIIFGLSVMTCMHFQLEANEVYNFSSVVVIVSYVAAVFITQIICLINGKRVLHTFEDIFLLCGILDIQRTHCHYLKLVFIQNMISIVPFIYTAIFLKSIVCQITWLSPFVMIWTNQLHFLCFIIIMYQCFSHLNCKLEQISITKRFSCPSLKLTVTSNSLKYSLSSKIAHIKKLHSYICDVSEYIEKTYSLQILLVLVISFFQIVWFLYALIAVLVIPYAGKYFISMINDTHSVLASVIFFAVKIMLNIIACTTTSNE
ncbi:hypothetical protein L9F63_010375, partial [Diploptera punctata]